MHSKNTLFPTVALILATALWGMAFAFIKDAVSTISPYTFIFYRFVVASFILSIFFRPQIKFSRDIFSNGLILGIFLSGTVFFQTIGLQYTSASTASFITGLSVLFVNIFECILNRKAPSIYLIISALMAILGISFITLADGFVLNVGDLWVLLCAFSFAGYILYAGKCSHLQQPVALTMIQSFFVALIGGTLSISTKSFLIPSQQNVWVAILFCGIFCSIVAFLLQLNYQRYVSATKAAIIFALEPVFATITAALYLSEHLTFTFFCGACLILVAMILAEKQSKNKLLPQS